MSEGTTFNINYEEYAAYQQAPQVLQDYIFRLSGEIETKSALLHYIAQHPEGRIALAKVALEKIESINVIIEDVIARLEVKEADVE